MNVCDGDAPSVVALFVFTGGNALIAGPKGLNNTNLAYSGLSTAFF